jgi:hypothetical protein
MRSRRASVVPAGARDFRRKNHASPARGSPIPSAACADPDNPGLLRAAGHREAPNGARLPLVEDRGELSEGSHPQTIGVGVQPDDVEQHGRDAGGARADDVDVVQVADVDGL